MIINRLGSDLFQPTYPISFEALPSGGAENHVTNHPYPDHATGGKLCIFVGPRGGQDFKAFLTSFRQFFLKKEPVFLDRVWGAALDLAEGDEEKSLLAQSRDKCFRNRQHSMRFQLDGHTYGPEEVFDTYIYGGMFHSDAQKMRLLSGLKQPVGHVWKSTVLFFVDMAVREIAYLKGTIEFMLRRREGAIRYAPSITPADTSISH